MTEEEKFFFQCLEHSTQFYRQTHKPESFQSFIEDPSTQHLFTEIDPFEQEDSLFNFDRKLSLRFSDRVKEKFFQLVSEQSPEESIYEQPESHVENTTEKRIQRTKKTKRLKKRSKKTLAQSQITKNACCNIVQKTISLIKHGEYESQLQRFCVQFQTTAEQFKGFILNQRARFTGSKALQMFLKQDKPFHRLFARFLKWFLEEKYIRHALTSGEMGDLKAYIKFKNEVILPLL